MAVKTITTDLAAYEALSRHKRKGESFSQVIKERFGRGGTGRELAALVSEVRFSPSTLRALEDLKDFGRVPGLAISSY